MKNTYYKIIMMVVIGILIYPSMVMAVWWNPLSWKIFQKKEVQVENKIDIAPTSITSVSSDITNIKEDEVQELKKEVMELKKQVSDNSKKTTPKLAPTIITPTPQSSPILPSQPSPVSTQTDPQLLQVAKQMLNQYDEGILTIKNAYQTKYNNALQGQKLCNSRYDIDVEKAKSDAEYLKTSYLESRSGFATSTSQLNQIEDALAYDLETYKINKESCLLKYNLPSSSILQKLDKLSKEVSTLRSLINTPDDAVKYQNELKSLSNEIISTAGLVGNY